MLKHREGFVVPVIDEDWIDLGTTYEHACAVLGIPMLWGKAEETDEELLAQADEDEDAVCDLQTNINKMAQLEADLAVSRAEMKQHLRDLGFAVPGTPAEGGEASGHTVPDE